jgi:hypothetical protein
MGSYLKNMMQVPSFSRYPDVDVRRLKSIAIEYQKNDEQNDIEKCIIDASYNCHVHTSSCFKKFKNDKTNKFCIDDCECRYRYPQKKKQKTSIQDITNTAIPWYSWHGSSEDRTIKEVAIKRNFYDAFQNVYCPAISYSKLTCNTNLSFIMPGPIAQYCFHYSLKGTQEDDVAEYELVKSASHKIFSKVSKYENPRAEAVRRLLATSFAHQSNNIVGAALASFITRNGSRFIFSHSFVWCPLRDIKSLLHGEKVTTMITFQNKMTYFQCSALHYLCRPLVLEDLSPFQFYSKYEVVKITSQNKSTILPFFNSEDFKHPSFLPSKQFFRQGVRARKHEFLVKIYQYDFPDSASFQMSIFNSHSSITPPMELYSEQVLLLFYPYRSKKQLIINNSYTTKLRNAVQMGIIGNKAMHF